MITFKLALMPYANAHVIMDNDSIILVSYSTPVIICNRDGWVKCTGLYSMTTRRHISAFVKEFLSKWTFQDIKKMVQDNYSMNYQTGEIKFN